MACTRARNVINPASQPDISLQNEIGQASFGSYSYPGQARSKRQLADCEMNFGNGFPIVNEKFNYTMHIFEEEAGRNQYPFMVSE